MTSRLGRRTALALLIAACCVPLGTAASAQTAESRDTIDIRGRGQVLHLYGSRSAPPVIVSSGDGGWIHLAPHVAEMLATQGFYVVGFDTRAYLESFTHGTDTLRVEDEPADYGVLIDFAARETGRKPVLIGVSEGAGLSVLAATEQRNKVAIAGVIGLGLSDLTELGWRWKDMVIYVTHGVPREPTFSVKGVVDRIAPLPLAAIHSTRDEYVSLAEVEDVLARAGQPKRLWIISAANHRFSDTLPDFDRVLLEALTWISRVHAGASR
jgi:alpha-beta hydrolase superfamily lysophospholipase